MMIQKKHIHRARREIETCWTHCVTGRSDCGAAHGGVMQVHSCRCGAYRETEINGNHIKYGEWKKGGK